MVSVAFHARVSAFIRTAKAFPQVNGGLGISILSTPKGVLSDREARKLNVGGEILASVW